MKTSVIKYRVADFLKRYPPFTEMSDLDLLDLAASGRVVFHESDEYVFQKDESRGSIIWVIQQGRIHLLAGDWHVARAHLPRLIRTCARSRGLSPRLSAQLLRRLRTCSK